MDKVYLDTNKKLNLIEILLIVGSILVAFNPSTLSILFPLFLVFAITYYIGLQAKIKSTITSYVLSGLIAFCFVGSLSSLLGKSIEESFGNPTISLIIKWLYYILLFVLIFLALTKKK